MPKLTPNKINRLRNGQTITINPNVTKNGKLLKSLRQFLVRLQKTAGIYKTYKSRKYGKKATLLNPIKISNV